MAVRWIEGFETYQTGTQWDRRYATRTGSFTIQAGRVFGSSGSLGAPVFVAPSFGLADAWGIGFGVNFLAQTGALSVGDGFYIEKGTTEQVHLEFVKNAGSFEVKLMRATTQLAITTSAFAYGVWHHFELKVTVHPSTGAYELRHNEVAVFSASGVNTANEGTSQADVFAIRFASTSTNNRFDDIFVWDGTGASNNDFLGDCISEGIEVNADGFTIQWTNDAGTGSNFQNVDDPGNTTPDETGAGGTNSSDTVGQKDLYGYTDLTQIQGNILAVQVDTQMAMASAGSRTVKLRFRDDGGVEADGDTFTVSSTVYDGFSDVLDVNPQSLAAWDVADINGGQFGVEVVS